MRLHLLLLLGITTGIAAPLHADPIDALIDTTMARLHVPGLAVAVVRDGVVVRTRSAGLANLEWQQPVTGQTRFQTASATKVFTGTLLMRLVQDGVVALADPVSKHLPDAPAAWAGLTIAHLAAHTSGFAPYFDAAQTSVAGAYAAIRDKPLAAPVGTVARYGTADYDVLSHLLEKVTGTPIGELLRTRVFAPLGFTCTTFEDAEDRGTARLAQVIPQRATTYRFDAGAQRVSWFRYPAYTYASGGAFSCLDDLTKWAVAMDRGTLLTPASERIAARPARLASGREVGFGVVFATRTLRGRASYGHSGGPALADVVRIPADKLTVIVLANQVQLAPTLAPLIAGLVLPAAPAPTTRDAQPARTTRDRTFAADFLRGVVDPAQLAAPLVADELRDHARVLAAAWPGIDRWQLIADEPRTRIRRYRAQLGALTLRWTLQRDAAGKLIDLEVDPD